MKKTQRGAIVSAAICGALLGGLAGGCGVAPKGGAGGGGSGGAATRGDEPFAPARITIHPLTAFGRDRETGRRQIEAHIELYDRWDHAVKGLGVVVFELYRDAGVASRDQSDEQMVNWTHDMTDPEVNARAYDPVTRTYRFLLRDGAEGFGDEGGAGWTLRAQFTRGDGVRLSSTAVIGAGQ